jgi:hypothetical protein
MRPGTSGGVVYSGNQLPGSIGVLKSLDQLSDCQLLKKDLVTWNKFGDLYIFWPLL